MPTNSPDQVPEEIKEERYHRFMQLQQQISAERLVENRPHTAGDHWMKLMKKRALSAAVWRMRRKSTVWYISTANLMCSRGYW